MRSTYIAAVFIAFLAADILPCFLGPSVPASLLSLYASIIHRFGGLRVRYQSQELFAC